MQPVKKILLVDDEECDRLLFANALNEVADSAHLITVNDGDEFLQWLKLSKTKPDLVFLDLNMPRKNGFDALKEMRQDPSVDHIPVIVLSSCAHETTVNRCYELGANFFAQKPTGYGRLENIIAQALSLSDLRRPSKRKFILYGDQLACA